MEEILASIRKIIEETDHSRADQPETPSVPPVMRMESAPEVVVEKPRAAAPSRFEPEVEAFRDALAGAPAQAAAPAAPEVRADEPRPFTLADVQRRLEGSQPRAAQPAVSEPEPPVFMDEDDFEAVESFAETVDAVEPDVAAPPAPEPQSSPSLSMAALAAEISRERPSIMSVSAGRQVAGAFDELKEAFMASRQKSFDEMAQEMMRPMLQDWLDNNLPVLVERLVREEIERIARG